MDSSKYRQVMTDLFFHGIEPDFEPEKPAKGDPPRKRRPPATKKSKVDELRAFTAQIAARNKPAE